MERFWRFWVFGPYAAPLRKGFLRTLSFFSSVCLFPWYFFFLAVAFLVFLSVLCVYFTGSVRVREVSKSSSPASLFLRMSLFFFFSCKSLVPWSVFPSFSKILSVGQGGKVVFFCVAFLGFSPEARKEEHSLVTFSLSLLRDMTILTLFKQAALDENQACLSQGDWRDRRRL